MIHKVSEFIVETGVFDVLEFNADCFLFTTKARLPLLLMRYHSTPGTTRNPAVSHDLLRQSDPAGESFMDNAG